MLRDVQQEQKKDAPIYFIRHKFNQAKNEVDVLQQKKIIAIHFNGEYHETLDAYTDRSREFITAYGYFQKLSELGGTVVIQYQPEYFYIAAIAAGTPILAHNVKAHYNNEDNYLKTLQLSTLSERYTYAAYPLLSALRPPYVTIAPLNIFAHNLVSYLKGERALDLVVNNLHPKMLEQMCDEWLRSKYAPADYAMRFELLRTGLTLPVIDIYAETLQGKTLNVQITHAINARKVSAKAKTLSDHMAGKSGEIGLFVGPEKSKDQVLQYPSLEFVSTESIFNTLAADPDFKRMLEKMIGIQNK
jgi:hypothetical protein